MGGKYGDRQQRRERQRPSCLPLLEQLLPFQPLLLSGVALRKPSVLSSNKNKTINNYVVIKGRGIRKNSKSLASLDRECNAVRENFVLLGFYLYVYQEKENILNSVFIVIIVR